MDCNVKRSGPIFPMAYSLSRRRAGDIERDRYEAWRVLACRFEPACAVPTRTRTHVSAALESHPHGDSMTFRTNRLTFIHRLSTRRPEDIR
jgi:hypothetical protein